MTIHRDKLVHYGTDHQDSYGDINHYGRAALTDKWLQISSGHYGYPNFHGRNVGGAFALRGAVTRHSPSQYGDYWRGGPNNQHYIGRFFAAISEYSMPTDVLSVDGRAKIAESYSKMKPTNPDFSYLNSVYELKDIPDMLKKRYHKEGLKDVASYHLGIQFGWLPLLSDTRKLVLLQRTAQKHIRQLLRDNGKPVRRSLQLLATSDPETVTTGRLYGSLRPVLVTQYYKTQPTWKLTTGHRDLWWAAARYRFWLPGGPRDIAWKKKLLAKLYGMYPSPSAIYNAIPWTWLIDWFTNLGSLIENLDPGVADRLAADYHYVMRHTEWYSRYDVDGLFKSRDGRDLPVHASATSTAFYKSRVKGGPFDLSLQPQGLSASQLGILGAMGISRL